MTEREMEVIKNRNYGVRMTSTLFEYGFSLNNNNNNNNADGSTLSQKYG